jgi:hypothetical protein
MADDLGKAGAKITPTEHTIPSVQPGLGPLVSVEVDILAVHAGLAILEKVNLTT